MIGPFTEIRGIICFVFAANSCQILVVCDKSALGQNLRTENSVFVEWLTTLLLFKWNRRCNIALNLLVIDEMACHVSVGLALGKLVLICGSSAFGFVITIKRACMESFSVTAKIRSAHTSHHVWYRAWSPKCILHSGLLGVVHDLLELLGECSWTLVSFLAQSLHKLLGTFTCLSLLDFLLLVFDQKLQSFTHFVHNRISTICSTLSLIKRLLTLTFRGSTSLFSGLHRVPAVSTTISWCPFCIFNRDNLLDVLSVHFKFTHCSIWLKVFAQASCDEITVTHLKDGVESLLVFNLSVSSAFETARVII